MLIEFSDNELDYVFRLLVLRPFAEVEPLIGKLRAQVQAAREGSAWGPDNGNAPPELVRVPSGAMASETG